MIYETINRDTRIIIIFTITVVLFLSILLISTPIVIRSEKLGKRKSRETLELASPV